MRLACAGNALYDMIAFVDARFLAAEGITEAKTVHENSRTVAAIAQRLPSAFRYAGGGALNTARVFAALGNQSDFAGAIGRDDIGLAFKKDMRAAEVGSFLQERNEATGLFCVMIHPDGARTTVVSQGAAPHIDAAAVPECFFSSDAALYLDGFLAEYPETMMTFIHRARKAGMSVALDVGGCHIAKARKDFFKEIIRSAASWIFMNEDEFIVLAEDEVDKALLAFSKSAAGTVVVKRAETGAVSVCKDELMESAVRPILPSDTTGAGDAFAAGFLAAAFSGAAPARCLRAGNRTAELAIQEPGMAIAKEKLRSALASVL